MVRVADTIRVPRVPRRALDYHHFHTAGLLHCEVTGADGTGHLQSAARSYSGKKSPNGKGKQKLSRCFVYRVARLFLTPARHSPASVSAFFPPGRFVSFFLFSFCFRERRTTPTRTRPPGAARGHELSAERQRRATEVARLVSPRTAIRPSYTSATIPSCTLAAPAIFSSPLSAFSHFPLPRMHSAVSRRRVATPISRAPRPDRGAAAGVAESRQTLARQISPRAADQSISRDREESAGEVIDFLSPSSVIRAHAH